MKIKLKVGTFLAFVSIIFSIFNPIIANAEEVYVYLGGQTAGFTLQTKGATVVGLTEVITQNGIVSPSKCSGIEVGDIILSMNGKDINNAEDIAKVLKEYKSGSIVTKITRKKNEKIVDIFPEEDLQGAYKIGVFVRDDLNGLGTVTFYTENGEFASLGHPVIDEEGSPLQIVDGNVYTASVIGVVKASRGKAGELKGLFIGEKPIGTISKNIPEGLYGKVEEKYYKDYEKLTLSKAQIGKAQIYTTIDGITPNYYDIEIVKSDFKDGNNKNYVIKITDKELISKTGGILQGMSGSPIIQNGKLVGAVTHVFLNDGTRGYGICSINMFDNK